MFHVKRLIFFIITGRSYVFERYSLVRPLFHVKQSQFTTFFCEANPIYHIPFHVKQNRSSTAVFHVKQNRSSTAVFHVKQNRFSTTVFHVKQIVWIE